VQFTYFDTNTDYELTEMVINKTFSFYEKYADDETADWYIEHSIETPFHYIFQILFYENIEHEDETTDFVLNIFVDKNTREIVYCEESEDLSLDENIFMDLYSDWIVEQTSGDLKGIMKL